MSDPGFDRDREIKRMLRDLGVDMSRTVPPADCPNCSHRHDPSGKGHCYMFQKKPGPVCGQFKERK